MTPIEYFKSICAIPHGSGNEKAVADYIVEIAEKHGLFCIRDGSSNVFVRKNASEGYEDRPSVLFAAHTDMVCEKLPSSAHDFEKDPLTLIEKDGFIRADGTTLGADDGAGVATMLSLMTSSSPMPETEYLFTSGEETGMYGAFDFDYSAVKSSLVINLDNGAECSACIGCASGRRYETVLPLDRTRKCGKAVSVTLSGLAGGHSGNEIDSGRRSAVKLLAHLLDEMYSAYPFHIASLEGGGKDNVIPPFATATVIFYGEGDEKKSREIATDFGRRIRPMLCPEDARGFRVTVKKLKTEENEALPDMLTLKSTSKLISALILAPQGVQSYIPNTKEVLSSVNIGIVKTENECVKISQLARAGSVAAADMTEQIILRLSHALGGRTDIGSGYPCWEYRRGGRLQDAYLNACMKVYGREPAFYSVHAGLECGIFYDGISKNGTVPEIISVGPNLYDIHTPCEKMEIASLERLDTLLKTMLSEM